MESNKWFAARFAMAAAFVLLLSTAVFAQPAYRSDRISTQGTVTAMQRVGDQYRVTLNHGAYTYYVPVVAVHNRDLQIGDQVRIDGLISGNAVNADMVAFAGDPNYTNDPYYRAVPYGANGWMSGVVTDVNRRLGYMWIRDDATGAAVKVDTRHLDRRLRLDARRGDHISVNGSWERRNLFDAARVEF